MRPESITARLIPLVALAALLSFVTTASGQSASVLSRDGQVVLVNKDVNGERWAITYDPERRYVSGNVLTPDGGADFIDCEITRDVPASVDLICYAAGNGWVPIGLVSLPRSFFGNWPIGGGDGEPATCLNIRGLRVIFGTGPAFRCGASNCGYEVFVQQSGCRITADFATAFGSLRLEATIGSLGLGAGTITRAGAPSPVTLQLEGRGLTRQRLNGSTSSTSRFLAFDYFGGTDAGRGLIEIPLPPGANPTPRPTARPTPRPGSASQAFLDLSADLFE